MRKLFFAGCLLVCAAHILCVGCAKRQRGGLTIEDGILRVGVEIGYPPMEYYDTDGKTLVGFDIRLTKALAEKLGLQVKYIDTAWEGILAGLKTEKFDIAVNVTILPERIEAFNFTKPYIENSMTIVSRKDSAVEIDTPEDIAGHSAAYQGGTTAQYFAEKLSGRGVDFTRFSYDKITNCFDDLLLQRVDFVVVDSLVAFDYIGKADSPFKMCWQGVADETIGICLKKGNDALTDALNKALDELYADGTMLKISREIFTRDMVSSVRE
jgi:polar amino acid transport system substrate-binding protein